MTNLFDSVMANDENNDKISDLTSIWNKTGNAKQIHIAN